MVDGGPVAVSGAMVQYYDVGYTSRMKLSEAPLHSLSRKTKAQLSSMLNAIKILPSEEGYFRDWRGLAHCAKLKSEQITFLAEREDPTKELIENWEKQPNACKLSDLQAFLGQLDRWDVVDDTNESFLADAANYVDQSSNNNKKLQGNKATPEQEGLLTKDDIKLAQLGLPPQQYHAYVLYADEDVDFATELIERMENAGLKLCDESRDLLGGTLKNDAILQLIRERCNRLIIVVSPAFLESSANAFFMSYAQALGIEQNRRNIVPCVYKSCILPPQLNFYFALHYENRGRLFNFWDKLQQSIMSSDTHKNGPSTVGVLSPKITITEIDSGSQVEMIREAKPILFPPPAKIRPGSSMFDLREADELDTPSISKSTTTVIMQKKSPSLLSRFRSPDKDKSKSFWDLSQSKSSFSSLPIAGSISPEPSSSLEPPSLLSSGSSTKKKEKWYKKIMTPKSSMDKKKRMDSISGNVTPTSTQSFDTELFLSADAAENGAVANKKKKKKKLLAW